MRRILFTLGVACILGLSGFGFASQPGAGPTAITMTGAAPVDAALVTQTFGWVLTPDQLLLSHDGGLTFSSASPPVPAGTARAAYFTNTANGVVVAALGNSLTIASTGDGGRTWRTATVPGAASNPAGYSSLSMSFGDDAHGAVLARVATSPAFSLATIFTTDNGGRSWSARTAPEAGAVRVEPGGRIWVAGTTLNSSTDQGRTWIRSQLGLAGPVTAATVSAPIATTLPVTVVTGDRTEVQLLTTTDSGRSWGQPARLPVAGRAGPGVRLAVVSTRGGPVVYDTVAGHAYRRDGTDLRPSGLPAGVLTVTFAPDGHNGWALAGYGTCGKGKQGCRYHHKLLTTADDGATWSMAAAWNRKVS